MGTDSIPKVVHNYTKRFMLRLIKVEYKIEDRRPDLLDYHSKYKHWIKITIPFRTLSWTFHSMWQYDDCPYIR